MAELGIALDLGTSGFRGQAIDLRSGEVLATAVTTRHPLPGANVIDHLHFALEVGLEWAHGVVVEAVNRVVRELGVEPATVARLAVCGNPIQLSLFEEIEIRDLAFAGKRKLEALGVVAPNRDARVVEAGRIRGLELSEEARVILPPAVQHEIGADALAMMIRTGMLEREEVAIATDYGTNAEIALVVGGTVYTGSTAAGPALEGQQIECGLLALPGAISDVEFVPDADRPGPSRAGKGDRPLPGSLRTRVLDADMVPRPGATVDPVTGRLLEPGEAEAVGITGTGVVALVSQGLRAQLIRTPRITTFDGQIHLPDGIHFSEKDLLEAGKAIGSIRAGHLTLCHEAGIRLDQVETAYMSGASGTYVDALKARDLGMIPPAVKRIYQVGNTSLAMARELVRDEEQLWRMQDVARHLRQHHCMFAASKTFEKVYILELSHWTEGMPLDQYRALLRRYGLPDLGTHDAPAPEVVKTVARDIPDLGERGLTIIGDVGEERALVFHGCLGDATCVAECPERALRLREEPEGYAVEIDLSRCSGVACRRCERACGEKVFDWVGLVTSARGAGSGQKKVGGG